MSNRRRSARERLEIYLVHLILLYRRLLFIIGLLLLMYAMLTMFKSQLAGSVMLIPAMFMLLLSNSFTVVLYSARFGAWLGTLWLSDDLFEP